MKNSWIRCPMHGEPPCITGYPLIEKMAELLGEINTEPKHYLKDFGDHDATIQQGLLLEQFFRHTALLYHQTQEDRTQLIHPEHADAVRAVASISHGATDLHAVIEDFVDGLNAKQVMRRFGRGEQNGLDDRLSPADYWDDKIRLKHWLNDALDRAEQISRLPYTAQFVDSVVPASAAHPKL